MTLHPLFITDQKGRKMSVVLSVKEYEKVIEELEELEDNKLYSEAKKKDDGSRILLSDYVKQRKAKKK
jgi:PHD/YefM family antitoxin component YafN of YafNO toxin-antitoxin module